MLHSQTAFSEVEDGNGFPRTNFAELRRQLGRPSEVTEGDLQRLVGLAQSLARVRAFGSEYCRVDISDYAASVLMNSALV